MPRPKTESPKTRIVTFRVDDSTGAKLNQKVGNGKVSEFVRNIVEKELEA